MKTKVLCSKWVFVMAEIKPKIGAKLALKSNLKSKMLEYGFDLEEV